MSSSHQPIYWDSLGQSMVGLTAYRIDLPPGTTSWVIANAESGATDHMFIAATAANIADATNRLYLAPASTLSGVGQTLYVLNGTGGALVSKVTWHRPGRQPTNDAGTATFTAI